MILLATKNEWNETLNMKEFPCYINEKGNKLLNEFKIKSKDKNSYDNANEIKNSIIGKNIIIWPVIYQNKFYQ